MNVNLEHTKVVEFDPVEVPNPFGTRRLFEHRVPWSIAAFAPMECWPLLEPSTSWGSTNVDEATDDEGNTPLHSALNSTSTILNLAANLL